MPASLVFHFFVTPAVDAFVQAHFPDQADRQVIALQE